jgi:tRNA dimethylallyltransferase
LRKKTLIIITGPTASGKTSLAIKTALHYSADIISADSRQCYRELNIGVAKPTDDQLKLVKHYFINSHSIVEEVNAATFASYAEEALEQIFSTRDVAVMVGGTGLYIRAFIEGLHDIPSVPAEIRDQVRAAYDENGISWLRDELTLRDPLYARVGEMENPQRMMRALEVKLATGLSIKEFHGDRQTREREYEIRKYALDIPREQLYDNINRRVDEMIQNGLVEEARSFLPYRHLNALQTVGYTELFQYFDGNYTLEQAIEKIKQNTRNYAKRQLTWFRREKDLKWIRGDEGVTVNGEP